MMENNQERICAEVIFEIEFQINKWGIQNHAPTIWLAILTAEVGTSAKEALEYQMAAFAEFNSEKDKLQLLRAELIQVAAVAVSMIDSLDRNEIKEVDWQIARAKKLYPNNEDKRNEDH